MLNLKKSFIMLSLLLLSFVISACSNNTDLENRVKTLEDKVIKLEAIIETQNTKATEFYEKQLELQKQAEEANTKFFAPSETELDYNRPSKMK